MAVNEKDVEAIVKQILNQMGGSAGAPSAPAAPFASFSNMQSSTGVAIPSTAHVAMLVEKDKR